MPKRNVRVKRENLDSKKMAPKSDFNPKPQNPMEVGHNLEMKLLNRFRFKFKGLACQSIIEFSFQSGTKHSNSLKQKAQPLQTKKVSLKDFTPVTFTLKFLRRHGRPAHVRLGVRPGDAAR